MDFSSLFGDTSSGGSLGSLFGGGGSSGSGGFDISSLLGGGGGSASGTPGGLDLSSLATNPSVMAATGGLSALVVPIDNIFNFSESINAVMATGDLSNWGSSGANATLTETHINQHFIPEIKRVAELISSSNLSQGVSDLSQCINTMRVCYHQKRVEHSKATSTKKANEFGRDKMQDLHKMFVENGILQKLKDSGFMVNSKTSTANGNPKMYKNVIHDGNFKVDQMNKNGGGRWDVVFNSYTITPPLIQDGEGKQAVFVDENGNATVSASSSNNTLTYVIGAAIAVIIYKLTSK